MTQGFHIEGFSLHLGPTEIARLSTTVAAGEVLTIMGPSGSGKSTLLAALIGALPPGFRATGRLILNDRDITQLPTEARRIGILFQDPLLFPHLSVGGNLAFALPPSLRPAAARHAKIAEALAEVGLEGFANRDPATLSGGQRARVALQRMLLAGPEAILLDEPFSGLDLALRRQIRSLVFSTAQSRGLPVILVTHDTEDAEAAGGRIVSPMGEKMDGF
jgi:putative thiamine transport system ATP-binding protein